MKKLSSFSILLFCSVIHMMAQIIHVPADKTTIQAGIDSSSTGDTVLVAEGTYFENINFMGKAVTVASGFILDGDTSHISKTIIEGSHFSNPDSSSTVTMASGEDTTSVLTGFTITGGKGTNYTVVSETTDVKCWGGGGIFINGSGGKITHNIIEENHVEKVEGIIFQNGGGLFAFVYNNHSLAIRDNVIRNNSINGENAFGGGISAFGGMILFEENVITNNSANSDVWVFGGGLNWESIDSEGVIKEVIIRNNLISSNFADAVGEGGGAAGFRINSSYDGWHPLFYNNIVHDNHTELSGGGAFFQGFCGSMFNNTIVNNSAGWGNNIAMMNIEELKLFNNIIWSPEANGISDIQIWFTSNANLRVFNNLLLKVLGVGSLSEFDNIYEEPTFQPGSFDLVRYSHCIGMGIDSVQIEGTWYYAPSFDFYGNVRPDPTASHPDLGAIESPYEEGFVYIPDTAFLYALIEEGADTSGDSLISYSEAEAVRSLNVGGKLIFDNGAYRIAGGEGQIVSLAGIESFSNLEVLNCRGNRLTDLDLTGNPLLKVLDCSINELTGLSFPGGSRLDSLMCGMNPLTDLDVSKCNLLRSLSLLPIISDFMGDGTDLTELNITSNKALEFMQITDSKLLTLDLSNNTALKSLFCYRNQLTTLDVSKNIDLQFLGCGQNKLTSLDVSANTELVVLACQENQLETLDVSMNTKLWLLWCWSNRLTGLDVRSLTGLTELMCEDNLLTELDLSHNTALTYINISDMPDLEQVCVWRTPFPPGGVGLDKSGSPNVYFTTECTIGVEVEEQEYDIISIYPNPVDDLLTVESEISGQYAVKITSLNGQLMFSEEMEGTTHQIDLSSFRKGIYFISIRSEDFVTTRKIIRL